jgi:hypothetical protein
VICLNWHAQDGDTFWYICGIYPVLVTREVLTSCLVIPFETVVVYIQQAFWELIQIPYYVVSTQYVYWSEWVSEWLLFNANSAIFQLYHVNFQWDDDEVRWVGILYALAHWNNSSPGDMSLHPDTLFWFRANQSLLLLLNAACLAEKQQIPIV